MPGLTPFDGVSLRARFNVFPGSYLLVAVLGAIADPFTVSLTMYLFDHGSLSLDTVDRIGHWGILSMVLGFLSWLFCLAYYMFFLVPLLEYIRPELHNQFARLIDTRPEHHNIQITGRVGTRDWRHVAAVRSMYVSRRIHRKQFNQLLRWRWCSVPMLFLYLGTLMIGIGSVLFHLIAFVDVTSPYRVEQPEGFVILIVIPFILTAVQGGMVWSVLHLSEFVFRSRSLLWTYKKVTKNG